MPKYTPKQVIERVNKLKGDRGTIENHWQEIADFIFPRKNDFITEFTPGEKRNAQVVDNTGMVALELLAGALHGMLTSPNSLWFGLSTGDQKLDSRDDVRMWLQDTAIEIHNTLNNSNFQTEIHEVYLDEIAFGTSVMSIEEDDKSVVRFATRHLKECYICENSKGRVDEVYRCFKWTAKDIVNEFGEGKDKVGEKVMKAYESGKDDQKFEIIHYVYPADYKGGQKFKYESQYILAADKMLLKSGGFNELPYVAPRWSKAAGEVYGRSPGMNALPEVKTVNVMAETIIKGAQKVVDPPLQAPDEGVIRPIKTKPGSFNYYRAGTTDRIEPIFNDSRIDFGFEVMKERHERIREAFFVNQLQLAQGQSQRYQQQYQSRWNKYHLPHLRVKRKVG